MGSGASKKESDDDQEIDTGEFEPIKNWQGEVSTKMWILLEVICYECTSSQLSISVITFGWLTRGAFIINGCLRNPPFRYSEVCQ